MEGIMEKTAVSGKTANMDKIPAAVLLRNGGRLSVGRRTQKWVWKVRLTTSICCSRVNLMKLTA